MCIFLAPKPMNENVRKIKNTYNIYIYLFYSFSYSYFTDSTTCFPLKTLFLSSVLWFLWWNKHTHKKAQIFNLFLNLVFVCFFERTKARDEYSDYICPVFLGYLTITSGFLRKSQLSHPLDYHFSFISVFSFSWKWVFWFRTKEESNYYWSGYGS